MPRVSIGVLGLGRMGRLHARVLRELADRFELVGAYDPAVSGPFADPADLIAAASVVVVAAPTALHDAGARAAIEAGRAVLVEKPLAATSHEARRLALAADAAKVPLFVGHSERFNPVVRAMRAWMADERTTPVQIDVERIVPATGSGEDVLLNLGVHDLDLIEHLTGGRAVVLGATGDALHSRLHFTVGVVFGTIRCGRDGERRRRLRLVTERTILEGDLLSPRLVARDRETGSVAIVPLGGEEPLRAQALALHAALSGDASPIATGHEGARAVELAEVAMTLRDRARPAAEGRIGA